MADTLTRGQSLGKGGRLQSRNRRYELAFQHDSNLVLYEYSVNGSRPCFDTGGQLLPPDQRPDRAIMQEDGNFVLYNSAGYASWSTETWQYPGSRLELENNGQLVVRSPDNKLLWARGC